MTEPTDPDRNPARGTCAALFTISEDFHQLLRGSCPRCTTGTGPCAVETLQQALTADGQVALMADPPSEPRQLIRH